ncbi:hypothetical protein [Streptomyces sp. L2]|uniref:hypothetical protein n=1 Tax=Streptomyces sp. L2 TaxID=2162665 RepID=UPI0019D6AF62|nr:hypothetical protein [Streptomyces sp. L2]
MPRGRHRHSPPLHRLLPPSAIAGVAVVCALGPWVFSQATALRALAAAAAATTVLGAVVMRRWDTHAGKQVADLTRARASDEWRFEERVAELETDLEESRELRVKLEQRLRAKRAELAGLRNEHASLLRRYATAETERASALEGRRLLEIEAGEPSGALALPPARSAEPEATEAPEQGAEGAPSAPGVFSPEGAELFRRALLALARFEREPAPDPEPEPEPKSEAKAEDEPEAEAEPDEAGPAARGEAVEAGDAPDTVDAVTDSAPETGTETGTETDPAGAERQPGRESEAEASSERADGHARAAAVPTVPAQSPAPAGRQPAGHYTVPTAVAVVPAAPARRPAVQGGFDFFGTQKETASAALDSVQNEDLADVVGEEALALHKAETEAQFKPADTDAPGIGQVIDLTAHDETEQINIKDLRSAAS